MSVLAACILLGIVAVSVQGEDVAESDYYRLLAHRPGETGYHQKSLTIECTFNNTNVMKYLIEVEIYVSELGQEDDVYRLASVSSWGTYKSHFLDNSEYDVKGGLQFSQTGDLSVVELTWKSAADGFCKTYTSAVFGVDFNGITRLMRKTVNVGPRIGSSCNGEEEVESSPKPPVVQNNVERPGGNRKPLRLQASPNLSDEKEEKQNNVEIPKYIQDGFPEATQDQQEEILEKINSIDNDRYDVSGIYQGRVYIATMHNKRFNLNKMDDLCKSAGGYLVELDSPEEQFFVRNFLKSLGNYRYYTGANDVDSEGNFVYYHSKKPVTNVVWKEGEPDNFKGNEDCVEILPDGLNDNRCNRFRGYICEIPLLDEDESEIEIIEKPMSRGFAA